MDSTKVLPFGNQKNDLAVIAVDVCSRRGLCKLKETRRQFNLVPKFIAPA